MVGPVWSQGFDWTVDPDQSGGLDLTTVDSLVQSSPVSDQSRR